MMALLLLDTIPFFLGYGCNPFMIFGIWISFKVYVPASIWLSWHMVIHSFIWIFFYAGKFMSASATNSSYFKSFSNYLSTELFSAKSTVSCLTIHVKLFFSICFELLIATRNLFGLTQISNLYVGSKCTASTQSKRSFF